MWETLGWDKIRDYSSIMSALLRGGGLGKFADTADSGAGYAGWGVSDKMHRLWSGGVKANWSDNFHLKSTYNILCRCALSLRRQIYLFYKLLYKGAAGIIPAIDKNVSTFNLQCIEFFLRQEGSVMYLGMKWGKILAGQYREQNFNWEHFARNEGVIVEILECMYKKLLLPILYWVRWNKMSANFPVMSTLGAKTLKTLLCFQVVGILDAN